MNRLARYLLIFVIVFHVAAFALEAIFWMRPAVYEGVLGSLSSGLPFRLFDQAVILKTLFLNKGFYNLFLALGGIGALTLAAQRKGEAGRILGGYVCLVAVGAGLVLALSTGTYPGAILQAGPAAVAAWLILKERALG